MLVIVFTAAGVTHVWLCGQRGAKQADEVSEEELVRVAMERRHVLALTTKSGNSRPGSGYYRSFVGNPELYDRNGGMQFAILFRLGLRSKMKVLEIGCGSLRLGKLLMPYLERHMYH